VISNFTKLHFSWSEYFDLLESLKKQINSDYKPDVIVSIGKGGSIPGVILAEHYNTLNLNLGLRSYTEFSRNEIEEYQDVPSKTIEKQNVLLIDDLADSGETFKHAAKKLRQNLCKNLKTACLFLKTASDYTPNYYARTISSDIWIVQPWES